MNLLELDRQVFLLINNFAGQNSFIDNLSHVAVNEYFVPTILSLLLFFTWFYWKSEKERDLKQRSVVMAVFAIGFGSLVIVSILNNIFERPRPFEVLDVNLLFYKPTDPSFPSNSSVVAFALASSIFLGDKKLGLAALFIAGFYGILRIFVGVHFPLDIIAGALIGVISVGIVNLFPVFLMRVVNYLRNALKMLNLEEFT